MRAPTRNAFAISFGLLVATSALATDGVLEVNQACVATGCFSGDAPTFPVTIDGSAGRSVRLTSDLVVPNENTTAIFVLDNGATDGATIDLGGFSIRGPTRCPGSPTSGCSPIGNGSGVDIEEGVGDGASGLVVRNGSVVGMGNRGVRIGPLGVVEGVRAAHNGGGGIHVDEGSSVLDSRAYSNGGAGFGVAGTVRGCVASYNSGSGFQGARASIENSAATANGLHGLDCTGCSIVASVSSENGGSGIVGSGTLSHNRVHLNRADGILASGATLTGNSVAQNGSGGTADGIECQSDCLVVGNTVQGSTDLGLRLDASSGYRENLITGNANGPVLSGVNLGDNFCAGPGTVLATCP